MISFSLSKPTNHPSYLSLTALSNMNKPVATIEQSAAHPFFGEGAPEKITRVAYHEVPHIKWFKGSRIRGMR